MTKCQKLPTILIFHEGWGLFTISNALMRREVTTPRSASKASNAGNKWHQSTLKRILTNPVYTGKLVYCKEETTNTLSKSETYKIRRKVDPENQVIVENTHTAIISEGGFPCSSNPYEEER
ncbi:recombinase family protein [Neobacillus mesonae]|uniref:recombinase family protein n=1 Tax=Neobacillus mesonae TaxID=1193713 RepID=UPI002E1E78B4|nr:recombinase family protein [Neobacillus mesonae]